MWILFHILPVRIPCYTRCLYFQGTFVVLINFQWWVTFVYEICFVSSSFYNILDDIRFVRTTTTTLSHITIHFQQCPQVTHEKWTWNQSNVTAKNMVNKFHQRIRDTKCLWTTEILLICDTRPTINIQNAGHISTPHLSNKQLEVSTYEDYLCYPGCDFTDQLHTLRLPLTGRIS